MPRAHWLPLRLVRSESWRKAAAAILWSPQNHLRQILHQYETHHNQHRPHRSLHPAAPLKPLPQPVILEQYRVRRQTRASGTINEYRLVA